MAIKISMPSLSPTMKSGKIVKWYKQPGDSIQIGDILADIETDKAVMEYESIDEGIMGPVLIPEGTQVTVGEHIGWILEGDSDTIPQEAKVEKKVEEKLEVKIEEKIDIPTLSNAAKNSYSTPAARARAKELGISINDLKNAFPNTKIRDRDVVEFASRQQNTPVQRAICEVSGMQRVIAERMTESKTTVPHFYMQMEVIVDEALKLQTLCRDRFQIKLTITHILVKCIGHAFKAVPKMNIAWREGKQIMHEKVDVSVAVALENDGLITPIIQDVCNLSLTEIFNIMSDLVERAKSNKLLPHEFQGGSVTISNLGAYGISSFYPIINLPQASILGLGSIRDEIYLHQNNVQTRKVCTVSISVDHRIINGATAAHFMKELKFLIENPFGMLV